MSSSEELASSSSSSVEARSSAKSSSEVGSEGAGEVMIDGESFGFGGGRELSERRVGRLGVDLVWKPAGDGGGLRGGPLLWGGSVVC